MQQCNPNIISDLFRRVFIIWFPWRYQGRSWSPVMRSFCNTCVFSTCGINCCLTNPQSFPQLYSFACFLEIWLRFWPVRYKGKFAGRLLEKYFSSKKRHVKRLFKSLGFPWFPLSACSLDVWRGQACCNHRQ